MCLMTENGRDILLSPLISSNCNSKHSFIIAGKFVNKMTKVIPTNVAKIGGLCLLCHLISHTPSPMYLFIP